MRRLAAILVTLVVASASLALTASPAHAYEVDLTITGAGQVVELSEADLVGDSCRTPANTPTGAVGVTCSPGAPDGPYGWGWVVRYLATPMPGYRFVRWDAAGPGRPTVQCDGPHTGSACQFATYDNLQLRAVFEDVTPPTMAWISGPQLPVRDPATFQFGAEPDPTFDRHECRVPGVHDWIECASGHTENPLHTGTHILEVRAVDASGNRSPALTWTWTVDRTSPETNVTAGPTGTVASTSATFEFTSNEQGVFACRLDNGPLLWCTSPHSYTGLAQGQHTLLVGAVDFPGNADPTPARRTWTVDTVAPDTTITDAPDRHVRSTTASFAFDSGEPDVTYRCSMDGTPIFCNPTYVVPEGEHTLSVAAVDAAGNVDPTPATHTWTADATAPRVAGTAPTGQRVSTRANVVVELTEAMREARMEARGDDGRPRAVTLALGRTPVAATLRYVETAEGDHRAVLDPARRLRAGREYRVSVTSWAQDLAGNRLRATTWRFRTRR